VTQEPDATQRIDPDRTSASEEPAKPALARWGPLELLEKIGEGAFGETFRARDPWLDREVALKLLKQETSSESGVEARVIQEGVLLARVSHPHVVTVHGAERHEGRVGMWMELIRGETLSDRLRAAGRLDEREVMLVGLDLCRALSAVHAAGIVHRDIKDANVMWEEGGRIVLMDFGAGLESESTASDRASLTGTPLYMAPELFRGVPASARTDLYAAGVLLYHLATGEYPVHAATFRDLREAHRGGKSPRPRWSGRSRSSSGVRGERGPRSRRSTSRRGVTRASRSGAVRAIAWTRTSWR
jgi:serine/threonine protein kinase